MKVKADSGNQARRVNAPGMAETPRVMEKSRPQRTAGRGTTGPIKFTKKSPRQ